MEPAPLSDLRRQLASEIIPVILANVTTHYPYHDVHLMQAGEPPHDPIAVHPAFGNSFDWHSSVHSHWTGLQLIEYFRDHHDRKPEQLSALEHAIAQNLSIANVEAEVAYLRGHRSYERPYGWGWALALAAAAHSSKQDSIRESSPSLRALAEWIAAEAINWLRILPIPVRHGVHSNTAFALGLMHDASKTLRFSELQRTIEAQAREWFSNDRHWPAHFERSGNDFLSPGLEESGLMRRILERNEFAAWWNNFLSANSMASGISVVGLPDVNDGQVVHLHGLNLSRAGALARIAETLQEPALLEHARILYDASARRAVNGYYSETHWLPTFAWDAATSIDRASETS